MFEVNGARIAELRAAAFLSQRELAQRARITQATLSRLELGKQRIQGKTVRALAGVLGVPPDEIVIRHGDPTEAEPPLDASTEHGGRMGG